MKNGVRKAFAALVSMLFSVLFFFAVLETALRIGFARSLDFSIEMWKYESRLKQPDADPQIRFTHRPGAQALLMGVELRINSHGWRDREMARTHSTDVYRIMMLGDSTTLGWGVAEEDTAVRLLERALNDARTPNDPRFEVINTGVGNYNTVQEVAAFSRLGRQFHPDLVVLNYFINDAEELPRLDKGLLTRHFYSAVFLESRFDVALRSLGSRPDWKRYYSDLYRDDRPGWLAAKDSIHKLAETAGADGTALLLAILPELHQLNHGYPFSDAHSKVRATASAARVPVIDLVDALTNQGPEETLWVTRLDTHPNRKANLIVAGELSNYILGMVRKHRAQ